MAAAWDGNMEISVKLFSQGADPNLVDTVRKILLSAIGNKLIICVYFFVYYACTITHRMDERL